MITFLLCLQADPATGDADPIAALIERPGSEDIEERDASAHRLRRFRAVALDALEKARGHSDSEVACRARDLYETVWADLSPEELSKLPFEKINFTDIDLHTLTVRVQERTRKVILFTNDLGFRARRAHIVSDSSLSEHPEVLFKAYECVLQANDFALVSAADGTFRVALSPGYRKPPPTTAPENGIAIRILLLRSLTPCEAQSAIIPMVACPQRILTVDSSNVLIVTDFAYRLAGLERIIRELDKHAD